MSMALPKALTFPMGITSSERACGDHKSLSTKGKMKNNVQNANNAFFTPTAGESI